MRLLKPSLAMDELLKRLNQAGVRYLLAGGQAMRLAGMPRFTMDWDFFIPPRDADNLACLNALLADELDCPWSRSAAAKP